MIRISTRPSLVTLGVAMLATGLAPCNVCLSEPFVSGIVRMKPDESGMEMFAGGVRARVMVSTGDFQA